MFKKSQRLSQKEFSEYFKIAKRQHFSHFSILTKKSPSRKVAVVVGKKVAKSAVQRNKIKRRVYATLRDILPSTIDSGVLIVLIKPSYSSLSSRTADDLLRKSIAELIKSA